MEQIANGRTADVFALGESTVVKLYLAGRPRSVAANEFVIARSVADAGIHTPNALELVEIDGRFGVVFERVNGPTVLEAVMEDPSQIMPLAACMGELHARIHSAEVKGLASNRDRLADEVSRAPHLSSEIREAAEEHLSQLPVGRSVLHGDFHPDNVLLVDGQLVVIDWPDASVGSPASDLARTNILLAPGEPPDMDPADRAQLIMLREVFLGTYLDSYRSHNPISDTEIDSWKPLVAAARLTEGIDEEEASLLALASQLLDP